MIPSLALLSAAAVWGATFILVREALAEVSPLHFLAVRFVIGTALLAAVWPGALRRVMRVHPRAGLITGALLAMAYWAQTAGLELTTATNAGFITGLYVVFTPLLAAAVFRAWPSPAALVGAGLAAVGLGLMSLRLVDGRVSLSGGDLLVLLAALAFAGQIVALGRFAPDGDVRVLTLQQLLVATVVFVALGPPHTIELPPSPTVWVAIGVTALGATAFALAVQTWAQQRLSPTRAAVIFAMEAPFAPLFAALLGDEQISGRAWMGAAVILAGMLFAELGPRWRLATSAGRS